MINVLQFTLVLPKINAEFGAALTNQGTGQQRDWECGFTINK